MAGASFTPSPIIATILWLATSSSIAATLSSGNSSARTSSMPTSAATARAVRSLSPVSMTIVLTPCACSRATMSFASGRMRSRNSKTPSKPLSSPTAPACCRRFRSDRASRHGHRPPRLFGGEPVRAKPDRAPADSRPSTPRPGTVRVSSAACAVMPSRLARPRIARARGCDDRASSAAADVDRSRSDVPPRG